MSEATHDAAPAGDPSMEDILASIRRILNEETPAETPEPALGGMDGQEAPLMLDQSMLSNLPSHVAAQPAAPAAFDAAPDMAPAPTSAPPAPALEYMPAPDSLLAPEAAQAASGAFAALAAQIVAGRDLATHRGGPTIEDLVRQEVRPLLKSWLDAHLPPMVERLVRAELERLSNRLGT